MMMTRASLVIAFTLAGIPRIAHADEASKRAAIRELFALNGLEARMEQSLAATAEQYHRTAMSMVGGIGFTPAQERIASAYYDKVNQLLEEALSWKKIEPEYEEVYMKVYTEEEIDGVVAFYKSPIGHAYGAKSLEASAEIAAISNRRMQEVTPQLKKLSEVLINQLSATN